ncbi:MAG: hypothetical protein WD648_05750 [Planctomycetaceae bacterium]
MNRLAITLSYSRGISRRASIVIACLLCCQNFALSDIVPPEAASSSQQPAVDATNSDDATTAAELKRKQRTVNVATLLLVGISIVGLTLIWMVMVWGRRLRRFARQQLPAHTVVDELWYLKPQKPTAEPGAGDRPGPDASSNETQSR